MYMRQAARLLQGTYASFTPKQRSACVQALQFTRAKQQQLAEQRGILARKLQVCCHVGCK